MFFHHYLLPHITSHHIPSHHITSHHITSHHITSHHIITSHTPPRSKPSAHPFEKKCGHLNANKRAIKTIRYNFFFLSHTKIPESLNWIWSWRFLMKLYKFFKSPSQDLSHAGWKSLLFNVDYQNNRGKEKRNYYKKKCRY